MNSWGILQKGTKNILYVCQINVSFSRQNLKYETPRPHSFISHSLRVLGSQDIFITLWMKQQCLEM